MSAGRSSFILLALGCLLFDLRCEKSWGQTLSPQKVFGRYQQFVWLEEHGLPQNTVDAILRTRDGYLWVGTEAGAARFDGARFTVFDHGNTKEFKGSVIKALLEDRAGNLWVGTKEGGISRVRDGRITTWINQDGRARNFIASFYEDRSGALWIGTIDDGLSRFKDGKFAQITVRDGLYDNMAFQILSDTDDDSGSLWMCCNRGVFRVSLKELNDFADGRSKSVTSFAYGVADGMLSRECNAASPAGWRTRDGRLWFPTIKGIVAIDPRRLNAQPPQLAIEDVFTTELEPVEGALARETEMNLYRIAQETINNLVRHSQASEARVTLRREADKVRLTVADNGQGFDPHQTAASGRNGFGLPGIAERMRLLRGAWEVHSAPEQGTNIEITVGDEEVR